VATRSNRSSQFGALAFVPGIGSVTNADDGGPTLTTDGRLLVFYSSRQNPGYNNDLWYAVRASASDPFGTPQRVPGVNSGDGDWMPFIRGDGCELFFASNRSGGPGIDDIYRVVFQ